MNICSPPKRKIFVCTSDLDRELSEFYIQELMDHYIVDIGKIDHTPENRLEMIKKCDIVVSFIESQNHPYVYAIMELGISIAMGKAILIFENFTEDKGDGSYIKNPSPHNTYMDVVMKSKIVVRSTTWSETKNCIRNICNFLKILESSM